MYRPSRETAFLQDVLKGFTGVLVSDFYSGYDSLDGPQQKCLVHLIRDFNSDLLGNPFDEELKALAAEFGRLLRSIVDTIDKHGLTKRHLQQHKAEVSGFFRGLETRVYRSDVAVAYQARFTRAEGKLFTFLDYDGVPWNNNPAEHAVKAFAYYRRLCDGMMGEQGLSDYLVLLSVQQTCEYRGVSFLKFLLSQEEDVEEYCRRGRKKNPPPTLEVYPEAFSRTHFKRKEAKPTAGDDPRSKCRERLAVVLQKIGAPAVSPLIKKLAAEASLARFHAIDILGRVGPKAEPAVKALHVCLKDADPDVRFAAAIALGKIGRGANVALTELRELANSERGSLQVASTWAIQRIEQRSN